MAFWRSSHFCYCLMRGHIHESFWLPFKHQPPAKQWNSKNKAVGQGAAAPSLAAAPPCRRPSASWPAGALARTLRPWSLARALQPFDLQARNVRHSLSVEEAVRRCGRGRQVTATKHHPVSLCQVRAGQVRLGHIFEYTSINVLLVVWAIVEAYLSGLSVFGKPPFGNRQTNTS